MDPTSAEEADQIGSEAVCHEQAQAYPDPQEPEAELQREPCDGYEDYRRSDQHGPHQKTGVMGTDENTVKDKDDSVQWLKQNQQGKNLGAQDLDYVRVFCE